MSSVTDKIIVRGAAEHNLKNIDVSIPRDTLCVVTGLSGSGKSSLAFDTIYAEGQRRYIESLSSYARQFLDQLRKPKVEFIDGLSPAISIEQKTIGRNPRSTVGTVTEIYDFLRVLYANVGRPHCPDCGRPIVQQTVDQMVDTVLSWPSGAKVLVMSPVVRGRKGEYRQVFEDARRQGFVRARVDGQIIELDDPPSLKKTHKHDISIVIDRLKVSADIRSRLLESFELALRKAEGVAEVERMDDGKVFTFSQKFACPECGISIEELTHRLFSFNSPHGACPGCDGLGVLMEPDESLVVPDPSLSISEGALAPWAGLTDESGGGKKMSWQNQFMKALAKEYDISLDVPFRDLPAASRKLLLYGNNGEKLKVRFRAASGSRGGTESLSWEGMMPRVARRYREEEAFDLARYLRQRPCPTCKGQRLKASARSIRMGGLNISEVCALDVDGAVSFFSSLQLSDREQLIAEQLLKEVGDRLQFLKNVGLGYLTLDRHAGTLSGGEAQRIRLATQIGSQLVGVLYVLDEPSIGLHQRDNQKLIDTLKELRDLGNTVLVVEHDEHTIRSADYVVDLGPAAGRLGGYVVAAGSAEEVASVPESITGQYLRNQRRIEVPAQRRTPVPGKKLVLHGAREHNLKSLTVEFPLGLFICITGVSGSGKSSLVNDILYQALSLHLYKSAVQPGLYDRLDGLELIDKVVDVDQGPIGRTPRSNPATYTGVFSLIRDLFAQVPEARMRGYQAGRFSFNVKGGRCEACMGQGLNKVEMHFLPDVYVECQVCNGARYNRETLEVKYKDKSIAEVLELTVEDACEFFAPVPSISAKMQTLRDVGLGYITLGQSATTLSGGEAQRIKLAKELSRRSTGRTVYVLDEPTTGLHFEDVRKLLDVLRALVEQGNTVIVIEHNLDVVKSADHLIDLGPDGGDAGGFVVAEGSPEKVAGNPASITGRFLSPLLGSVPSRRSRRP